ncbi:hypothetical protein QJ857_gp0766 [Tupanvirus soda lake]|uniref:Uncharacterized protein n=2 Tax=Tupanvirus TaxID=2094720 RepID=A0A6N1NZA8_9VIRU|nr:hypothetical protein QJ857_gp0766 [Tupanvirus soda lake]QKU35282.1 hypothetical protein [Tupanvirus soda lake]
MYTRIYQNSYIVLIITFILLCVIFYLFEIGYNTEISPEGKVIKTFSWKYPLAISLIVWVFWHFYLFPPLEDNNTAKIAAIQQEYSVSKNTSPIDNSTPKTTKLMAQRINMVNWN